MPCRRVILLVTAILATACAQQSRVVVLACEARGGDHSFGIMIEDDRAMVREQEWEAQTTETQYHLIDRLTDLADDGSSSSVLRIRIDRVTGGFMMLTPGATEGTWDITRGTCVRGERKF